MQRFTNDWCIKKSIPKICLIEKDILKSQTNVNTFNLKSFNGLFHTDQSIQRNTSLKSSQIKTVAYIGNMGQKKKNYKKSTISDSKYLLYLFCAIDNLDHACDQVDQLWVNYTSTKRHCHNISTNSNFMLVGLLRE